MFGNVGPDIQLAGHCRPGQHHSVVGQPPDRLHHFNHGRHQLVIFASPPNLFIVFQLAYVTAADFNHRILDVCYNSYEAVNTVLQVVPGAAILFFHLKGHVIQGYPVNHRQHLIYRFGDRIHGTIEALDNHAEVTAMLGIIGPYGQIAGRHRLSHHVSVSHQFFDGFYHLNIGGHQFIIVTSLPNSFKHIQVA
ncbi:hypothetical protein Psfp_02021 [Pelotomaculum sp. FP]|nr:hypothetical protein Psfp_02021 [Pelotomaculum sp. FP]